MSATKKATEQETQKKFIEKIVDSLPHGLYVIDRNFTIVAWNTQRETGEFGIPKEEVLGKNVFKVFNLQVSSLLKVEFDRVFETGKPLPPMRCESWRSGKKKVYLISKIPMSLEQGETTHVITLGQDITREESVQKELEAKAKLAAVGLLASGVAHEINNPLSLVSTCAEALYYRVKEALRGEDLELSVFKEYLETIGNEVDRCRKITTGLLDFSTPRQSESSQMDMHKALREVLYLLRYHERFRRIRVKFVPAPGFPPFQGNSDQLKQVLIGLILNAMDSMEETEHPLLEITTDIETVRDVDCLVVRFKDNGCGIPSELMDRLFDPFFTTKDAGKGVGLGLSICWGIVRSHGGTIDVNSTPEEGSVFKILLPLQSSTDLYDAEEYMTHVTAR